MLGLFSNKSDHPLANLKSAQQLLDGLPKTDSVKVLNEIGHWIETLFDPGNQFRLDHKFAVLRILDEAAYPHLRKIVQSYFALVPLSVLHENRLWGAMNAYYTFCDLGYLDLLIGLQKGEKGSSAIKSNLSLICARGIYAVFGRMECAAVRYRPMNPQRWMHLVHYFAYAEQQQLVDEPISLYAGKETETSVMRIYASVLIWYTASIGSLSPVDSHTSKCLIIHMSKLFEVNNEPVAGSIFAIDLDNPGVPVRVQEVGIMYPLSTRFVSMGTPLAYFENLLKTMEKGHLPEDLSVGVGYSMESVSKVVKRVAAYCKMPLPLRRHQRRKINMQLKVLNGFDNVVEQTKVGLNTDSLIKEDWKVEDVSATGLSCVINAGKPSTVKIGSLLAFQPEKTSHWGAGIVRQLRLDKNNNLHVGVKVLANRIVGIALHDHENCLDKLRQFALLVDRPDDQSGESWMLMKSDTFAENSSPTFTLGEQEYLMEAVGMVEKCADFDWVSYRMRASDVVELAY